MANPYIWGNLNRAVNDPTLIDEAIGQAIEAHESNPEAHLGADESLQSHRASEIIDHRAESVVNDKLALRARHWTAIVDPTSESDFDTIEEAVSYAALSMPGDILIKAGTHFISSSLYVPPTVSIYGEGREETIIDYIGPAATVMDIQPYTDGIYCGLTGVSLSIGTNIVNFSGASVPIDNNMIGMTIITYQSSVEIIRTVLAVIDGNKLEVSGAALTAGSVVNNSLFYGGTIVDGANYLTLGNSYGLSARNIYAGQTLYLGKYYSTKTTLGVVDRVDNDGNIWLREPYSGATVVGVIEGYLETRPWNVMCDFSLNMGAGTVGIYTEYEDSYISLLRVSVVGAGTALSYSTVYDSSSSSVRDCRFTCTANTRIISVRGFLFDNCEFEWTVNVTADSIYAADVVFENCLFRGTPGGGVAPFSTSSNKVIYARCDFVNIKSFVLRGDPANAGYLTSRVDNCTFLMRASQTLGLNGRGVYFTNNIIRGTTGAFTLATGSQRNVVSQNISDGAFTNNGTNNIMVNNSTY